MVGLGQMRHRFVVQQQTRGAEGDGAPTKTWQTVGHRMGSLKPLRGREELHGMQLQDRVTHRIVVRYMSGVDSSYRLVLGSRIFNVRSAHDRDEKKRFLNITAEEGAAT